MNNTPVQVFLTSGLAVNLLTGDSVTLSEEECSRYRNDVMFRSEVNSALAIPVSIGSQNPDYLTFTIETTRKASAIQTTTLPPSCGCRDRAVRPLRQSILAQLSSQ